MEYEVQTIHELFEECAKKFPENIAIAFGSHAITYKDLDEKSNQVATALINKGVKSDTIVGLYFRRSIDMVIGILGILKAGGAFLPIDPDYPEDRVDFILKDSMCNILLSHKLIDKRPAFKGQILEIEDVPSVLMPNFKKRGTSSDLAYVIYTSGSTGQPKGVLIEHGSVVNFIEGITSVIGFEEKTILALTTISFDIFILEMLLPLTRGMKIVIADEEMQKSPRLLAKAIHSLGIDMVQMTPSRMQILIGCDSQLHCMENVKDIMIGGEEFPLTLLEQLKSLTRARIYNMYGPTETTIWSTVSDLTEKNSVDIGKPINNTGIYIDNGNNSLQPTEGEGELCITGDGLARGYMNRPELTQKRFVDNPFVSGKRMYKTGDLAKWLPDGNIKYLGRVDEQVKIRGFRVELGEVTNHLLKHPAVKQAVVTINEGKQGNKYLCAYFVSDEDVEISALREHMKKFLPHYMIPESFIRLQNLPQTPNQKIDKKALPDYKV